MILIYIPAGLLLSELLMRLADIRPRRLPVPRVFAGRDGAFTEQVPGGPVLQGRPSRYGLPCMEFIPNMDLKTVYASNPRGYFDSENAVVKHINSRGLHGPEFTPEKPKGTYRIIGLGDSFTYGEGVREEDTFLRRLENALNAVRPRSTASSLQPAALEVINAGVPGYNVMHEAIYLEDQWLSYAPDLVLVVIYLNDAYDNGLISFSGNNMGLYHGPQQGLAQWSRLWDQVQHTAWVIHYNRELKEHYREPAFTNPRPFLETRTKEYDNCWIASRKGLGRIAELSRQRGFRAAVIIFPELYRLAEDHPFAPFYRMVEEDCAALGLPALSLLEAFKGRDPSKLWVHPTDHHPNEEGHRIAAEAIVPFIQRVMDTSKN